MPFYRNIFNFISTKYIKNFFLVLGGGVLSQVISFSFSPVLSRLYLPEFFGIFSSYSATAAIISVICCARYELAIMPTNDISESINVLRIALFVSACLSVFSLFLVAIFFFYEITSIGYLIYIYPIVIFLSGVNLSLNIFHNKLESFSVTSLSKVIQALVTGVSSALLSFVIPSFGLIFGTLVGLLLSNIFLLFKLRKIFFNEIVLNKIYVNSLIVALKKYSNYPKFTLLPSFLNIFSNQSINYVLVSLFGNSLAGYFFLASRVVYLPVSIIGTSVNDILFQKLVEKKNAKERVVIFILQNTVLLILIGLLIVVPFFLFSDYIFLHLFGVEWSMAASISKMLIFSMLIRLVVSPLTITFTALEKINIGAYWQYFYFLINIFSLGYFMYSNLSLTTTITFMILVEYIAYLIAFVLVFAVAYDHDKKIKTYFNEYFK